MKNYAKNLGLTLLELLVVISIVAILAAVAVPAMDSTVKSNSVRALQRSYLSAFAYARGEAVSRNKMISICPSRDETTCSDDTADWAQGWLIFVDDADAGGGNGELDAGEDVIRANLYKGRSIASVVSPDQTSGAELPSLTWNYRGYTHEDQRALVVVCPSDSDVNFARGLMVERSGRVVSTQDRDPADGVHEVRFDSSTNVVGTTPTNADGSEPTPGLITQDISCG